MALSFSYSVPRVTSQQLQDEREAMTIEEREELTRALHGREAPIAETPEFLEEKLNLFDHQLLATIVNSVVDDDDDDDDNDNPLEPVETEAFETAQLICPEYVNSNEFRLMFLRSTKFDVGLAATKMFTYWSRKVELFGADRAFRKLTLQDLEMVEQDREALTRGGLRALPMLDEGNRGLLWSFRAYWCLAEHGYASSMNRLLWYMVHVLAENVEVQRNGMVCLFANGLPLSMQASYNAKLGRRMVRDTVEALPVRIQACHQSLLCNVTQMMLESMFFVMPLEMRAKYQLHSVSPSELATAVEPFGIPLAAMPPEFGGDLEWDWDEWLQERRAHEAA